MPSKRRILSISLALATALAAPGASAIFLNDEAFRAAGGDPGNPSATAEVGLQSSRARSLQAPFDAVGTTPGCTATVLGTDDLHVWILTAAHCVGPGLQHFGITLPTVSAWGLSRVYHAPDADIALASIPLPLPVSPAWRALSKPLIYDGDSEVGRAIHLVGTGAAGVGETEVSVPDTRLHGVSRVVGAFDDGTTILAGYAPGTTDLQARAARGDHGSAGWLQHAGGYWSIAGVASAVDPTGTFFTRINRHVDWMKGIFPGVTTFTERFTVTESRPFVSRNHAEDVDHGTVYYLVAPDQPGVQGPTARTWINYGPAYSTITVTATDAITGTTHPVVLRASRENGCGSRAMENGVICYASRQGPLSVSYHAADNSGMPHGEWMTTFQVDARGWHRFYDARMPIHVHIRK